MSHTSVFRALAATTVLAATLVAAPAFAQDGNDPLGEDLDNYWSVDRDLPVLQERLYERDGRFGFGLYTGIMSSEPFYWYLPVGGRLSYFFNDHAGLEVGGQFMDAVGVLAHETEITTFFENQRQDAFDPALDLEDRFLWRANATLVWHPLYGKWSFLNNKLSHFDFNLALGGGVVSVTRPSPDRQEANTVMEPELTFGGGVHFFMGQHWTLRLDGRMYVYRGADTPSARADYDPQDQAAAISNDASYFRRLQVPSEFLLGVSYLF